MSEALKKPTIFADVYLRNNFGDDLFLDIICERYPEAEIIVAADPSYAAFLHKYQNLCIVYNGRMYTCRNVNELEVLKGRSSHGGIVQAVIRKLDKLCTAWRLTAQTDCYVRLGGSLFIHSGGNILARCADDLFVLVYYSVIRLLSRRRFVIGSNYGPDHGSHMYRRLVSMFLRSCEDVCFRDQASVRRFSELNNVRVRPDVVFSRKLSDVSRKKQAFVSVIELEHGNKEHEVREKAAEYNRFIEESIMQLHQQGYTIVLSGFCSYEQDDEACKRYADFSKEHDIPVVVMNYEGDPSCIVQAIGSSEIVIASRFHANILAISAGSRLVPIAYSDKTTNVLMDLGIPRADIIELKKDCNLNAQHVLNGAKAYSEINIDHLQIMASEQFAGLDAFLER